MLSRWRILYRGPLSSCNYGCTYCPFAKTRDTRAQLADDATRLARFVDQIERWSPRPIGVLFTPWGEALIRRAYQQALARLAAMPHVERAAIQTNLSGRLGWLRDLEPAHRAKIALWTTWHPTETPLEAFVARCRRLDALDARYSVGVVGLRDQLDDIERMRALLRDDVYLWVNAYKREPDHYSEADVRRIEAVDPLFRWNTRYHASAGRDCAAGAAVFSVDGDGTARRCHFIEAPLGNIYDDDFADRLRPTPCGNATCGCHIGYVHLRPLALSEAVYGDGVLERIPREALWRDPAARERLRAEARARLGPHPSIERPAATPRWAGRQFARDAHGEG